MVKVCNHTLECLDMYTRIACTQIDIVIILHCNIQTVQCTCSLQTINLNVDYIEAWILSMIEVIATCMMGQSCHS